MKLAGWLLDCKLHHVHCCISSLRHKADAECLLIEWKKKKTSLLVSISCVFTHACMNEWIWMVLLQKHHLINNGVCFVAVSVVSLVYFMALIFLHHHMNDVDWSKIIDVVRVAMERVWPCIVTIYAVLLYFSFLELDSDILRELSVDALSFSGS